MSSRKKATLQLLFGDDSCNSETDEPIDETYPENYRPPTPGANILPKEAPVAEYSPSHPTFDKNQVTSARKIFSTTITTENHTYTEKYPVSIMQDEKSQDADITPLLEVIYPKNKGKEDEDIQPLLEIRYAKAKSSLISKPKQNTPFICKRFTMSRKKHNKWRREEYDKRKQLKLALRENKQ